MLDPYIVKRGGLAAVSAPAGTASSRQCNWGGPRLNVALHVTGDITGQIRVKSQRPSSSLFRR
jgi:hypothetical protein